MISWKKDNTNVSNKSYTSKAWESSATANHCLVDPRRKN